MKGKLLVCHYCKNKFPSEELIQTTKTRRSCSGCIEEREKKKVKANEVKIEKAKEKEQEKDAERDDYRELIDYICKGFGQTAPIGKQLNDIRRFNKELGYTYKEIQWTLYYIFCVLKKRAVNNSLGLVPYYHKEAKDHFLTLERVRESSKDIEIQKEITIIRNSKGHNPKSKARLDKTRYVNIEEIY